MYNFHFEKPGSVADAVKALGAEDAQALGGGQTLIPTLKQRLNQPSALVSLTGIPDIKGVCMTDDGMLSVGGATTHAEVARAAAAHYPGLAGLASHIGDPAVRNRGTIGGSLANNDPAACYPAAVLASRAVIRTNTREIPVDEYFQGMFTTALEDGEIITEVRFAVPQASNYQKFVQPASRFALVGVFVARFADGVRVAVTGAAQEGVFRWSAAEESLSAEFSADAVPDAPDAEGLIADLHATPKYRAALIKTMTKRAVTAAT